MFITYKITNKITGKYYIGSHKTADPNDDYMGSGRLIRESIAEYGVENHKKEILGVFDTREESLELEHQLIKSKKKEDSENVLNITNGGSSFDYINNNLTFDRAYYGSMASHEFSIKKKKERIYDYDKNPVLCKMCKKPLPYEKRHNVFCSQSCSAKFNNPSNSKHMKESIVENGISYVWYGQICLNCGKKLLYKSDTQYTKNRKYCSSQCACKARLQGRQPSELKLRLLSDKEEIKVMHENGRSYREIAEKYSTSANTIKDLIKGRIKLN